MRAIRQTETITLWVVSLLALVACRAEHDLGPPAKLEWTASEHTGALPPRLTGTDGKGLALVSLEAHAIVQEPLAFTELHMRFRNPEPRRREGTFEITLPPSAAISRFAMRIGDSFQEGEVVERQKARHTYEDFLHRKQDPALLEHEAGNHFSARVFPINAGEEKEIILSFSEDLSAGQAYRLRLAGLPTLEDLGVRVLASDGPHEIPRHRGPIPGDLVLTGGRGASAGDLAVRANGLYLARITPKLESNPAEVGALTILFDTSASGALAFDKRAEHMVQLVEQLSLTAREDFQVKLVAFDQTVVPLYAGPISGLASEGLSALRQRRALGASDLEAAFTELGKEPLTPRLLLVSDAVVTAGETSAEKLGHSLKRLREQGLTRLDVLLTGGIHDQALAQSLVSVDREHPGVVVSENEDDDRIIAQLTQQPVANVPVKVSGAHWWSPRRVPSLLPGQSVTIVANLRGSGTPEVSVGTSRPVRPRPLQVEEPLLQRAWARAKLAELEAQLEAADPYDVAQRGTLEAEIISVSTRFRVLSKLTALLVLESEQDYTRFGIDRLALSDILTVGPKGLQVLDRQTRGKQVARSSARPWSREGPLAGSPPPGRNLPSMNMAPMPRDDARVTPENTMLGRRAEKAQLSSPMAGDVSSFAARPSYAAPPSRANSSSIDDLLNASLGGAATAPKARSSTPQTPAPPGASIRPKVTFGAVQRVAGTRSAPQFRRLLEHYRPQLEQCYTLQLRRIPDVGGLVRLRIVASEKGVRTMPILEEATGIPQALLSCTLMTFTETLPENENTTFIVEVRFGSLRRQQPQPEVARSLSDKPAPPEHPPVYTLDSALEGPLLSVLSAIQGGNVQSALVEAWRYRVQEPGNVVALIALGQALAANDDPEGAARAYGSIIDLYPSRSDMRRAAGNYLESLTSAGSLSLALDSYGKAREQRPDHPNSHRLHAYALLKAGRHAEAFQVLREGYGRSYPQGRFAGAKGVLQEDLRIVASAWKRADPDAAKQIDDTMHKLELVPDDTSTVRFVLSWETDANDVDLHIYDARGGHAFFGSPQLGSGGNLAADVTTGYGPERFLIENPRTFPYQLVINYYARGPMGIGMGKLQVTFHDGKGDLSFEERPFVIMRDRASVDLGKIDRVPSSLAQRGAAPARALSL